MEYWHDEREKEKSFKNGTERDGDAVIGNTLRDMKEER